MPAVQPDPIDDRTPLMLAVCERHFGQVLDLIFNGAEIDAKTHEGWTALTYAVSYQEYEIARQLLDSGANPNPVASYDMQDAPLALAACRGDFDLVRLLIAHGADPDIYSGTFALRAEGYARRGSHHHISEFLLYHEDKQRTK